MRTISFPKANDAKDKKHFHAGQNKFSPTARAKSFGYAWSGIIRFFKTEPNARLHLAGAIGAILLLMFFPVARWEAVAVVLCIALVVVCEMLNTAIEKTMDFISTKTHPQIKLVKDIAAGAVLVAALCAFTTAAIIFIPKIF